MWATTTTNRRTTQTNGNKSKTHNKPSTVTPIPQQTTQKAKHTNYSQTVTPISSRETTKVLHKPSQTQTEHERSILPIAAHLRVQITQ